MQTALKQTKLLCFIITLSCLYQHLWARCALVFQYKRQTQFMIDDSGNVIDARIIQNAADATPDEALIIEKNHQLMLWAHDNHVFIPGALHECTDTAAYPNTGLQFESGVGHAAELTDAGDLYISGKETVRQPTAMVTYVDNSAVYELNADKVNELQYHHLGTPLGTEGRIFADNRTEFYVKDHLGSVRSVIAERHNGQGYDVVEYTSYYHYGSIKDALERPGQVREKFTGKELDEDGQSNGSPGLQLYYFGARFYDPVAGVWLSVDKAEQFFSPYAYAGNGANPVVMVDKDGNWIFTALFITGIVASSYFTTAGAEGNFNPAKWDWDAKTFAALGTGAAVGAISAGIGGAVSSSVMGAVGIASGSGLVGAIAGGAAGGAVGGAIGWTGSYTLQTGLNEEKDWNAREYFKGLGFAAGGGALVGGAIGGISYGVNPNAVNQQIIKWGYDKGNYQGAIDFVSCEYNISGNFIYREFPGKVYYPNTARGYTTNSSKSYIYKNAFTIDGKFDPSSVVQTVAHEGFHQSVFISNINRSQLFSDINEFYAYQHNLLTANRYGLSNAVSNYAYKQWLYYTYKTPFKYMFFK